MPGFASRLVAQSARRVGRAGTGGLRLGITSELFPLRGVEAAPSAGSAEREGTRAERLEAPAPAPPVPPRRDEEPPGPRASAPLAVSRTAETPREQRPGRPPAMATAEAVPRARPAAQPETDRITISAGLAVEAEQPRPIVERPAAIAPGVAPRPAARPSPSAPVAAPTTEVRTRVERVEVPAAARAQPSTVALVPPIPAARSASPRPTVAAVANVARARAAPARRSVTVRIGTIEIVTPPGPPIVSPSPSPLVVAPAAEAPRPESLLERMWLDRAGYYW